jgi:hypothetical protein
MFLRKVSLGSLRIRANQARVRIDTVKKLRLICPVPIKSDNAHSKFHRNEKIGARNGHFFTVY